jgi:hypothetical protein
MARARCTGMLYFLERHMRDLAANLKEAK